jgi:hypothetical protein
MPSHIPNYFAARLHRAATPPQFLSEQLQDQQETDLHAEDLKPAELRKLKQELDLYNAMGRIVTYNKILKDWATWSR